MQTKDEVGDRAIGLLRAAVRGGLLRRMPRAQENARGVVAAWEGIRCVDRVRALAMPAEDVIERARRGHA